MNIKKILTSKNANTLAFFNVLGPIILNGINFFTVPIFTRLLGTNNYGIVSIYTTWVQVFSIIMGLQTGGTIAVSKTYFKKEEQRAYYSSILSLSCLSSAIITLAIAIFIKPVSAFMQMDIVIIFIMLLQSFGTYVVSFATLKFTYEKEAPKNFAMSLVVALVTTVLSIVLIPLMSYEERYVGRIVGYAVPNILAGIVITILFFKRGRKFYSASYWKFCLPLCLPLIFHNLSQIILGQSDRIMLQKLLLDNGSVGIYSFIFTFTHLLSVIWGALNNTWVPFYYDYMREKDVPQIKAKSKNYVFLFTILCMGFMLLSPEAVRIFASKEFWKGTYLIPIMTISCYMVFLYSFPVNFEFYYKQTPLIAIGTCCAAGLNIILNLVMIPKLGILGAAVATTTAYIFLFVFHQLIARYIVKNDYHYTFRFFLPGSLAVVGVAVVFYITLEMWYIRWGIACLLGIILLMRIYKQRSIF